MISWGAVRTIAVTLASRTELAASGDFDYARAVERTLDPLSRFTGIELPQGPPNGRQLRVAEKFVEEGAPQTLRGAAITRKQSAGHFLR